MLGQTAQESAHKVKETLRCIKGIDYEDRFTVNQYSLLKGIGEGSFASVKLVQKNQTYEQFALKQIKRPALKAKASPAFLDAMREIDILKEFSHPNIIKLYEVIDDPNDDKLYLVLEYAARG